MVQKDYVSIMGTVYSFIFISPIIRSDRGSPNYGGLHENSVKEFRNKFRFLTEEKTVGPWEISSQRLHDEAVQSNTSVGSYVTLVLYSPISKKIGEEAKNGQSAWTKVVQKGRFSTVWLLSEVFWTVLKLIDV